MLRSVITALVIVIGVAIANPLESRGRISAAQVPSVGDPQQLKQTLLERMKREPPTYRGDNNIRLKWEWYNGLAQSYLFEKSNLLQEASAGQPNLLRPQ